MFNDVFVDGSKFAVVVAGVPNVDGSVAVNVFVLGVLVAVFIVDVVVVAVVELFKLSYILIGLSS